MLAEYRIEREQAEGVDALLSVVDGEETCHWCGCSLGGINTVLSVFLFLVGLECHWAILYSCEFPLKCGNAELVLVLAVDCFEGVQRSKS